MRYFVSGLIPSTRASIRVTRIPPIHRIIFKALFMEVVLQSKIRNFAKPSRASGFL
jgi:hypothetical protein